MDTSKFAELGLNEQILAGVEALGFTDPTPVQAEAIPLVLAGRDVVASAQTGTGKTAAFALPVLQVIEPYSRAARGEATTPESKAVEEDAGADDADAGGNTVLADVMTGDAHLSATVPEAPDGVENAEASDNSHTEETGNGAASFAGDVAAEPAVTVSAPLGTDQAMEEAASATESLEHTTAAASPADRNADGSAPKRPRRRHHKRAFALRGDSAEGVESAVRDEDVARADAAEDADSSADAASQPQQLTSDDVASAAEDVTPEVAASTKKKRRKRRAKKARVVEVSLDGITPGEQLRMDDRSESDSTEDGSGPGPQVDGLAGGKKTPAPVGAIADAGNDPDAGTIASKPKKPKRKRSRKRSKKKKDQKSGLAAEIAAAEDPNAKPFGPFALVVTPTRELAQQIENVVSEVCEHTGQRAVIVMGGTKFDRQIRELQRGCDLLVATPGRLLDLMEHDHVDLSQVKVFVLDEADRMLDMGFWPSVRCIVAALPKERQTLLFSATIPPSIKGQVDAMLRNPAKVEIARIGETADTVEEHLCPVTQGQKIELLEALVRHYDPERVLVFCRTKHRVDDVSSYLARAGLSVEVMHADRTQKERERALAKFRAGKCKILVATDVMSRGIDVSGIDAVVNFDVPMDSEDYVHRIGRTGRAGHTGLAFTFVAPDEISPLREIEYFTHKLIPVWDLEGFEYDSSRIVPNPDRSTTRSTRTMFNGARARGRGMRAGRYGRHY